MAGWENWSREVAHYDTPIYVPGTVDHLQEMVLHAAQTYHKVRCVGPGHSWRQLGVGGALILMHNLDHFQINHTDETATIGPGVTIHELGAKLHAAGCALPTMGDTDRQSFVGAASTDTHGSGKTLHGLGEYIVSMKIVTAGGSLAEVTSDEDLRAARVSIGRLGAIAEVTVKIRTTPLWLGHHRETIRNLREEFEPNTIAQRLADNTFLEYWYFPYTRHYADRITRNEIPPGDEINDYSDRNAETLEEALRLEREGLENPSNLPKLTRVGVKLRYWTNRHDRRENPAHMILPAVSQTSVDHLKTHTMEYLLPLADLQAGFDALYDSIEEAQAADAFISTPVHIRFVAKSTSHLSPYKWDPTVSFSTNFSRSYQGAHTWFPILEEKMRALGGSCHLGKISYHPTPVPQAFENVRATFDPGGVFDNPPIQYPTPESQRPLPPPDGAVD